MLYFDDIAKLAAPELFKTTPVDYYLEEGIAKLESMLLPSSYFAFWPGGTYAHTWSNIYAVHFLVEARKAGYQVSDRVYDAMINGLKQIARGEMSAGRDPHEPRSENYETQRTAYALYVLALAGKPELSAMLYMKNNKLRNMSGFSQFQLAGAFALAGDMNTANSLLPRTITMGEVKRETGGNFNSSVRARAIMLATLAEVDDSHPSIPALVESLTKSGSKYNRWYTTQENAFAFLALGKILKKQISSQYKGVMTVDGGHFADFDSKDQRFEDKNWGGKEVILTVEGAGACYYYWQASGILVNAQIEETDNDLKVRRRYLDRDGKPLDYANIRQGDVIVSELKIKALTENLENVVITDMLPAGFEIENPRLQSRAGISWIGDKNYKPDYMDIRDDRLIIFGKFPRQQEQTFYYALRAVTQGDFILPPVTGEAMYAPAKSSVASSGNISVVE